MQSYVTLLACTALRGHLWALAAKNYVLARMLLPLPTLQHLNQLALPTATPLADLQPATFAHTCE